MTGRLKALGLALSFLAADVALAQPVADPAQPAADEVAQFRILADHAFLPNVLVPPAFADSNVQLLVAFGRGSFPNPTGIGPVELDIGSASPRLRGHVRILRGLSLILGVSGTFVTGMDVPSAVGYGATTSYGLKLGALYELVRSHRNILSLAFEVDRPHTLIISPIESAVESIRGFAERGNPDAASSNIDTAWRPTFRYAHAFTPAVGFQAIAGLSIAAVKDDRIATFNPDVFNLGFSFDANLRELSSIPLGLTATYYRAQPLSNNGNVQSIFGFGIYETLARNFNFGFEMSFASGSGQNTTAGAVVLRSHYN